MPRTATLVAPLLLCLAAAAPAAHYDLVVLSPTELVAMASDVGGSQIYSAKKIRGAEER